MTFLETFTFVLEHQVKLFLLLVFGISAGWLFKDLGYPIKKSILLVLYACFLGLVVALAYYWLENLFL